MTRADKPIASLQNDWNNNYIRVPSFILSGAPFSVYPKIALWSWSLIGHLARSHAAANKELRIVRKPGRDRWLGRNRLAAPATSYS